MRFAAQRYPRLGYEMREYRAQPGRITDYRAQSGSAGMPGIMTNYQAPNAQQIAFTQMPPVNEPAFRARSGANNPFRAPIRL
ncbi:MAG: hypothetical protein CML73_02395 [Rhodobiaceae bacterium]|nr:hypothetical protein [Rhodobiaceae bacterium]